MIKPNEGFVFQFISYLIDDKSLIRFLICPIYRFSIEYVWFDLIRPIVRATISLAAPVPV